MKNSTQKNSGNIVLALPDGQTPLVRVNVKYPLSGDSKIDKYITNIASGLERFASKKLVARAKKYYRNTQPSQPFSLVTTFRVTLDNERLFCFYLDVFVWQGNKRSTVKRIPLNFDRGLSGIVFPLEKRHRRELTGNLRMAISKVINDGGYFSDWEKRARRYFRKTNAVISQEGIYVTYNSGILAPHDRGAVNILIFPYFE